MKVIKRGGLQKDMDIKATCRHCKSELEFKRGEAILVPDWRDGDYLKIACPVCSNDVIVGVDATN